MTRRAQSKIKMQASDFKVAATEHETKGGPRAAVQVTCPRGGPWVTGTASDPFAGVTLLSSRDTTVM